MFYIYYKKIKKSFEKGFYLRKQRSSTEILRKLI